MGGTFWRDLENGLGQPKISRRRKEEKLNRRMFEDPANVQGSQNLSALHFLRVA